MTEKGTSSRFPFVWVLIVAGKKDGHSWSSYSVSAKYFLLLWGLKYNETIPDGLLTPPNCSCPLFAALLPDAEPHHGGHPDRGGQICGHRPFLLACTRSGQQGAWGGWNARPAPVCLSLSFTRFILCFLERMCIDSVEPLQPAVNDAFDENWPGSQRQNANMKDDRGWAAIGVGLSQSSASLARFQTYRVKN